MSALSGTNWGSQIRWSVDLLCISETKLDESFPTAQFAIKEFNKRNDKRFSNHGYSLFFLMGIWTTYDWFQIY